MTFRPRIAGNPHDVPRESRKVKTVAAILETTPSHVRQLIAAGQLDWHPLGKRGVRVYLDSVADYQARVTRSSAAKPDSPRPKPRPKPASTAAYRASLASLKAKGYL